MYDFIEWNPEQVAECAKKCDAAGEIFSKSKLTSISTGAQHQEDLDELIQDINGLIAGLTLACAGVSQATTAVNQAFQEAEEHNRHALETDKIYGHNKGK
jgi:hypothetical protein